MREAEIAIPVSSAAFGICTGNVVAQPAGTAGQRRPGRAGHSGGRGLPVADYAQRMGRLFHVSSAANRGSILAHGLDWARMGAAPGIAGSRAPEAEGIFLCLDEFEAGMFVRMNNTGGPVDVWAVTGVEAEQLIGAGSGYGYYPAPIPPGQVALCQPPQPEAAPRAPKQRRKNAPRSPR